MANYQWLRDTKCIPHSFKVLLWYLLFPVWFDRRPYGVFGVHPPEDEIYPNDHSVSLRRWPWSKMSTAVPLSWLKLSDRTLKANLIKDEVCECCGQRV